MSAVQSVARLAAALSFVGLAACGGGDADPTLPAAGNLVVNSGNASVATGTYALDTSYTGASEVLIVDDVDVEMVYPEHAKFDSGFLFAQSDPSKYGLSYYDSASGVSYMCVSKAWTSAELVVLLKGLPSVAICAGSVTIDATKHSMQIVGAKLVSTADASKAITISANFSWVLQDTTPHPFANGDSGGGSGGGEVSSGPAVSTAGTSGSGSTVTTGPTPITVIATPAIPAASAL
jgi:hypothetical protein